jgi:hypothetical protein
MLATAQVRCIMKLPAARSAGSERHRLSRLHMHSTCVTIVVYLQRAVRQCLGLCHRGVVNVKYVWRQIRDYSVHLRMFQ